MKHPPAFSRRICSAPGLGNTDPLAYLAERQCIVIKPGQKLVALDAPDAPEEAIGERKSPMPTLFWSLLVVGFGAILLTVVFATSDLFHPADRDGNGLAVSR